MDSSKLGKGLVFAFCVGVLGGLFNIAHDVSHFVWLFAPRFFDGFGAGARWAHLPFLAICLLGLCVSGASLAGFCLVNRMDGAYLSGIASAVVLISVCFIVGFVFVVAVITGAELMLVWELWEMLF